MGWFDVSTPSKFLTFTSNTYIITKRGPYKGGQDTIPPTLLARAQSTLQQHETSYRTNEL